MADSEPTLSRNRGSRTRSLPSRAGASALRPEDYLAGFGEELAQTLDLERWRTGVDLGQEYRRIEAEVRGAVTQEDNIQRRVREEVHPRLAWQGNDIPGAGCHRVAIQELRQVHEHLLFRGGVEACDGVCQVHETLALTMCQLSVSLVSYRGNSGVWMQRLFRRDLQLRGGDPVEELVQLLEERARRSGQHDSPRARLSQLARRGILSFAERAILTRRSTAPWRLGDGSPAPLEMVGASFPDLVIESIRVFRELVEGHQKFVFVSNEYDDLLYRTIGQSLYPLEYAILGTLRDQVEPYLGNWRCQGKATVDTVWDGKPLTPEEWVIRFRDELAPRVVVGVFKATRLAPPQMFYAHQDHSDVAVRVALADSVLHELRGGPMLLDLALSNCRSAYGGGDLNEVARNAYASANAGHFCPDNRPR